MVSLRLSRLQEVAPRCQICLFLVLALGSGALLPIQARCHAQLRQTLHSPIADDDYHPIALTQLDCNPSAPDPRSVSLCDR